MTTFPQAPLDVGVDLLLASDWTDITDFVYQRDGTSAPINIKRGKPDEATQPSASSASLEANNRDGRFSWRNPLGAWYGQIGRNTPLRISVPDADQYLRMEDDNGSYVQAPDTAGLSITGDIEIQIDLDMSNYAPCALAAKWTSTLSRDQRSWMLMMLDNGHLEFLWTTDGTDLFNKTFVVSTAPLPLGRTAIKVTLDVSSQVVTFYTAPTIGGTYTQLGASGAGTSASTGIFDSTASVTVGGAPFSDDASFIDTGTGDATVLPATGFSSFASVQGKIYGFKILSGIGGTVKASPDFTAQTVGAGSFSDAQSNTWTLQNSAEISDRNYRFHGELSELPVQWDSTGKDVSSPLAAAGLLRRLGQNPPTLDSALKRSLLSSSDFTLAAYWPCEDGSSATSLGSAVGGQPMTIANTGTASELASDTSFLCSNAIPVMNGGVWTGPVQRYTANGIIKVRFLLNVTVDPGATAVIMRVVSTGGIAEFAMRYYAGGDIGISGWAPDGSNVFDTGPSGLTNILNKPVWVNMELIQDGSGVDYNIDVVGPSTIFGGIQATNGYFSGTGGTASSVSIGRVTNVIAHPFGNNVGTFSLGHISVHTDTSDTLFHIPAVSAYVGETAGDRFARLCTEQNVAWRVYGNPLNTAQMGAQTSQSLLSLLQECVSADLGVIYEPATCFGLGYRTLASMLDQDAALTLDYSQGMLGDGSTIPIPTDDDQYTVNDVTGTRSVGAQSGSSFQLALDDGSAMSISDPRDGGVGDYPSSTSANLYADSQLMDVVGWLLHLGTVDEERWPVIPVCLARSILSAVFFDIQNLRLGDYLTVENLPSFLPPGDLDQLVVQTTESLGAFFWNISWACVPASPYSVAVFDDAVWGRADTDGSTLHSSATTTATSLSVDTSDSSTPLWTTLAADFPFDIAVGGEQMTVTNITGTSSPQTFTVTRHVNGIVKAHSSGEDVRLFFPPVYSLL